MWLDQFSSESGEDGHNADNEESSSRDYYEVEKIIGFRKNKGEEQYKIKWKGYPKSQNTWEPVNNLSNVKDMIDEYNQKHSKLIVSEKCKKSLMKNNDKVKEVKEINKNSSLKKRRQRKSENDIKDEEKKSVSNIQKKSQMKTRSRSK